MSEVRIGTSCLTKDLVWCECGRGLSLTGKWLYCPRCGSLIDQHSYHLAVLQAHDNGARLYRDADSRIDDVARVLLDAVKDALAFLDRPDITTHEWYKLAPEHVGKFRRAIAKAEDYENQAGSGPVTNP